MEWSNHNQFQFLTQENTIRISSKFDSGNLQFADLITPNEFELTPGQDCINPEISVKASSKMFFHFKVSCTKKTTLKFRIKRMKIIKSLFQDNEKQHYQPCFKKSKDKQYQRLKTNFVLQLNSDQQIQLCINYDFQQKQEVYFAFNYPYSYTRMMELVRKLNIKFKNDNEIYLTKQVLIYSLEGRMIPMVTITNHQGKCSTREENISNAMFPESCFEERPWKFNKPIIIISARVHPGQAPSSYALQGFLEFLLDKNDYRAFLLRKYFTFLVIPMLNPDGVYKGMYRMDSIGQNLNRFYNNAQSHKQPSVYAIRSLFQYYEKEKKLTMYFDIHAHASRRGFFMYGNAFNDFVHQVESKVFSKIMSLNCQNFTYNLCNYSKQQMTSKDTNEIMTKEGCSRVVAHKIGNILYSYTLQIGFHSSPEKSFLFPEQNKHMKFNDKRFVQYPCHDSKLFEQQNFKEAGRALLISILDIYEINPYSRLQEKYINKIRSFISREIHERQQRFKLLDNNLVRKMKRIHEIIFQSLIYPVLKKFNIEGARSCQEDLRNIQNEKQEDEIEKKSDSQKKMLVVVDNTEKIDSQNEQQKKEKLEKKNNRYDKFKETLKMGDSCILGSKDLEILNKMKYSTKYVKLNKFDFNPFPPLIKKKGNIFIKRESEIYTERSLFHQSPQKIKNLLFPTINNNLNQSLSPFKKCNPLRRPSLNESIINQSKEKGFSIELKLKKNFELKYQLANGLNKTINLI